MSYALITGASKGIGRAMAHELARRKTDLLLVARSEAVLGELAAALRQQYGVRVDFLATDLSLPGAAARVKQWCTEMNYPVSTLVNNAGYGLWGRFDRLSLAEQRSLLQLNVQTLVELSHEMLSLLQAQPKAYILNVASTAAYQAVPTLSVYAASKAFVVVFTRGLRYELRRSNVSVSCLSPGATSTQFIERAGMQAMQATAAKFEMTSEVVARIGIDGMLKGKAEIIPGLLNRITVRATYLLPKWLTEKLAANLYEKHLAP
ncbi:MAG: SDR family oxidoreductase [Ferruginibacter sp.]|nr:SDR family oxidoreductase [Cytophagales bacterium]